MKKIFVYSNERKHFAAIARTNRILFVYLLQRNHLMKRKVEDNYTNKVN